MRDGQEIHPVKRLKHQPIAQGTLVGEMETIGHPYVTRLSDGSYVQSTLPLTDAEREECERRI